MPERLPCFAGPKHRWCSQMFAQVREKSALRYRDLDILGQYRGTVKVHALEPYCEPLAPR
jgi:hypothetical protein